MLPQLSAQNRIKDVRPTFAFPKWSRHPCPSEATQDFESKDSPSLRAKLNANAFCPDQIIINQWASGPKKKYSFSIPATEQKQWTRTLDPCEARRQNLHFQKTSQFDLRTFFDCLRFVQRNMAALSSCEANQEHPFDNQTISFRFCFCFFFFLSTSLTLLFCSTPMIGQYQDEMDGTPSLLNSSSG